MGYKFNGPLFHGAAGLIFAATAVCGLHPASAHAPERSQAHVRVADVSSAQAQEKPVVSQLEAMVVEKGEDGRETFRKAERVNPGEVIEYRIAHTNQSGVALKGMIVQGPIPDGTVYLGGSASSPNKASFQVLVPGEDWQGLPAFKAVKAENGESKRVEAEPSDYRSIRWVLEDPLANKSAAEGIYRVKVRDR